MKRICSVVAFVMAVGLATIEATGLSVQQSINSTSPSDVELLPTNHQRFAGDASQIWMMPSKTEITRTAALNAFVAAVKFEVDGNFTKALPMLSEPLLRESPLSDYVQYYKGLAERGVGRAADARRTFQALAAGAPAGFLAEAAALGEAACDEALGDPGAALVIYERLATTKTTAPDDLLMRLGRAAKATGNPERALTAFSQVYYGSPFSDLATAAGVELDGLPNRTPIAAGTNRYKLELGRAEQLFGAKRYLQARAAFEGLQGAAQGDDRELVDLRIAESDYFLKRPRNARDGVRGYIDNASRQGEALFFYALALYDLGDRDQYFLVIRRVADEFPTQSWSEEALNNLATHFIIKDEDQKADETFREIDARFPSGRYAERAAWKIGWLAYRNQQYADVVRVFESAAGRFPRSDYRPSWLYWSARAHEHLNETALAQRRYTLTATDYLNSYYGRLALTYLEGRAPQRPLILEVPVSTSPPSSGPDDEIAPAALLPRNQQVIRALLGLGLYDQAVDELHYAQKVWGDSAPIEATLAWIYQKQGQSETGSRKFSLYRSAINTMKRAYPQYLAAGGEHLPNDVLRIIFPLAYWDLIRQHAALHDLDPYVVAALVAQESTFVADVQSSAKAVGLMQLMAPTARRYAKTLKLRYSSRLLTNPEMSIRIGTTYLADSVKAFGDLHLALASYNAGERNVRRWLAERPGLPRDEFIDDIPFPETQNYVKKILGTAEDYRRLYGPEAATDIGAGDASAAPAARPKASTSPAKKTPAQAKRKPGRPT